MKDTRGFCLYLGQNAERLQQLSDNENLLIHCLVPELKAVQNLQSKLDESKSGASVIIERWTDSHLPHAENLANLIIVDEADSIARNEIERVLAPNGVAFIGDERIVKSKNPNTDEWTHQWHGGDGSLTTQDREIDIPSGIQWLSGPLFAMAGRKSSTQTLVSAGGVNFYVTQNVLENVGQETMDQYLVARDAYNGIVKWQRSWNGPFVTGDGETNPRLAASSSRLFAAGPTSLMALDIYTGETIGESPVEQPIEQVFVLDNLILTQSLNSIQALDFNLENTLWSFKDGTISDFRLTRDNAFVVVSGRSPDGRFQHKLVCIDPQSGSEEWRVNTQPNVESARVKLNFVTEHYVSLIAHGHLHMYSASDGQHLWSTTTDARPGKDYVDERFVGHFFQNGLVWMLAQNSLREFDGQNVWVGLDPQTGEVQRELKTIGPWPNTATPAKMGCQLLIASDRYIIIPRQATFVDFETGEKHPFKFTRGGCGLGFVPANGLVYSHPHACGCFSEAIRGFMGMHSNKLDDIWGNEDNAEARLEIFAETNIHSTSEDDGDWPVYRANGERSAYSSVDLGQKLNERWSVPLTEWQSSVSSQAWRLRSGNLLTAPTVSGDAVFVADVDAGKLFSLDRTTGQVRWEFHASGRIDSPPSVRQGLCVFGSHDGYIYCLESASSQLLWKYRAAPADRRIVAFGNVESTWPVTGTVLFDENMIFTAAGRAPDADGGIVVRALDAASGHPIWSSKVDASQFRGVCDYVVKDGNVVCLGNQRFDAITGALLVDQSSELTHLQGGKVGLLEASWTKHDLALRKDIQTWSAQGASGQLLAWSPKTTASYNAEANMLSIDGEFTHELPLESPSQLTALVITDSYIVAAGGVDRSDETRGGFVQLIDLASGKVKAELTLPAEPVFDGLALSGNCIYVSTQAGQLHCLCTED
ncbi:outer membrane protein assembly factor BamB family protein [Thalassoglobus neptunius]|uniref:outer membrane protein assembly factor BamB family protein n=1 Tax=Thalassoglobus neptunius TaxID=1938619 RepID=UPI0018D1FA53|nr:PQQ-binding-like beta-propeller repeat protein [Thalassoglobus neptunius]